MRWDNFILAGQSINEGPTALGYVIRWGGGMRGIPSFPYAPWREQTDERRKSNEKYWKTRNEKKMKETVNNNVS